MKKIILLLLFITNFSYSQNDSINKPDPVNRALLSMIKKQDVFSSEVRDLLVSKVEKIKIETKDTSLSKLCDEYITSIKKIKIPEAVEVDLSKATKEDLKKFEISNDKFNKNSNIFHKGADYVRLTLILQIKDNKALIALRSRYTGKDWIFMNYVKFLVDDNTYDIEVKDPLRNVYTGMVTETAVKYVDLEMLGIINKIINSNTEVNVRFLGNKGNFDFIMNKRSLTAMKEVLDLYNKIRVN
ncbi:MAG: hypothetical protein B7Y83_00320 [Flavobacteriales bacterium 32-34-25]|nr:MAG: hypothetical protein B7Y83_00320 [Flavobacteriales bacterium 32-34-25]